MWLLFGYVRFFCLYFSDIFSAFSAIKNKFFMAIYLAFVVVGGIL